MRIHSLALAVAATLALGLAACGKQEEASADAAKDAIQQSTEAAKQAVDSASAAADKATEAAKATVAEAATGAHAVLDAASGAMAAAENLTDKNAANTAKH